MSEEEVERRWQERIELIRAVKRRNWIKKKGLDGESLGLGDAVIVAKTIEKTQKELKKELGRESRVSPLKGRRSLTTIERKLAKERAEQEKEREKQLNPRIKAKGVEGLTPDADGYVRLQDAKKARPDLFAKGPKAHPLVMKIIQNHRDRKNGNTSD